MTVATGGAFACAWSPCCTKYAIGCQDGSLAIYDVRTHEPLLQLKSPRVQTKITGKSKCLPLALTAAFWNGRCMGARAASPTPSTRPFARSSLRQTR